MSYCPEYGGERIWSYDEEHLALTYSEMQCVVCEGLQDGDCDGTHDNLSAYWGLSQGKRDSLIERARIAIVTSSAMDAISDAIWEMVRR